VSTDISMAADILRDMARSLDSTATRLDLLALGGTPATPAQETLEVAVSGSGWSWKETGRRSGVTYSWPTKAGETPNLEKYDPFVEWEGTAAEGRVRLGVGECERAEVWGKDRLYFIVFIVRAKSIEPVVEFLEADDGDAFVAIIRGKGRTGREMFAPGDELPAGYEHLPVEPYRDHVADGYRRLAVVARQADPEVMLEHALMQARLRYGYRPEAT
jgi:hypothetical protein